MARQNVCVTHYIYLLAGWVESNRPLLFGCRVFWYFAEILDEAERSLHDALCILSQTVKNPRTVWGGGSSEMLMSQAVEALVKTEGKFDEKDLSAQKKDAMATPGKEILAIKAFERALRAIPTILADNAGYDSNELVSQLEGAHAKGVVNAGLDMERGIVGDMSKLKITESLKSKMQVLVSAHEAAEMILRVDEIIHAAPRYVPHPHHTTPPPPPFSCSYVCCFRHSQQTR